MTFGLRVRQAVKRAMRAGYWLWSRRLEGDAVRRDRSDYKGTWQTLSTTEQDAKMFVASDVDEDQLRASSRLTLETLDRLVGIRPDDVVLEIGCGVGRVGAALAPRCARWIGTDISANMLGHAAKRLSAFPNVSFVELSGNALREVPAESADVVYCTVVFMHLYEWDRFRYVQDALRVLRPGGRAYFDNVDIASAHGWRVFSDSASYPPDERPAYLPMTSSADELRTYAERAGYAGVVVHRWADAWVAVTGTKPGRA